MKINTKLAKGIHVVGDDFEKIVAVRKPNADTKITWEIKVKCRAKELQSPK